jgi:hypothetical protein
MYQTISAVIPRGDLRQRGDRLLVIRVDPFLQLLVASRRHAQCATMHSSSSHAAIFYFPLGPVFDLSLCRALMLFSTPSLWLCYFLLYEALHFRARARRSRKAALRPGRTGRRCGTLLGRPGTKPSGLDSPLTARSSHVL